MLYVLQRLEDFVPQIPYWGFALDPNEGFHLPDPLYWTLPASNIRLRPCRQDYAKWTEQPIFSQQGVGMWAMITAADDKQVLRWCKTEITLYGYET